MRRRVLPVLWLIALLALVWAVFQVRQATFRDDVVIVLGSAVLLQLVVLVMLAVTKVWAWHALGLLALLQGVATYFGALALMALGWIGPRSDPFADAIRAALLVGGLLLLAGMILLAWITGGEVREWFDPDDDQRAR